MSISNENTRTNITIPKDLKKELEKIAKEQNRSFNNLVVTVLLKYKEGLISHDWNRGVYANFSKRRNKYYHEVEIDLFYNLEDPKKTEDCLSEIVINNYINKLCDRDKKVLQYRQKGMYIYEIQKKLDISRQYIGLISFRHKKNIKKELMLEGGVVIWH